MEDPRVQMTYAPLDGGEDKPVYQCCALVLFQPHQAMYHLWMRHDLSADEAWDVTQHLRGRGSDGRTES
jgi:hypothetical protein